MVTETTQNAPRLVGAPATEGLVRWRLHWLASPDAALAGSFADLGPGLAVIGRDPASAPTGGRGLTVSDRALSRQHVALLVRDGATSVEVTDLGSRNGTAMDGRVVTAPVTAKNGSVVRCGSTILLLEHRASAPDSPPTAAVPGRSAQAHRIRAELVAAAADRRPVLIVGPTGSGKERAAGAVHDLSGRSGPLLRLNVAAVPDSLFEAEFFGHAKGAYSGAGDARAGWVQQANGGTLVLDEIGELPLALQAKLLRLLEDQYLRPLGAKADVRVDVQFVATTNADLTSRVHSGQFRQDLAARLKAHEVHLSAVCDRRADLFDLADAVVPMPSPASSWREAWSADAAEAMLLHDWPDNLRELDRVLRKLSSAPRPIEIGDLPKDLIASATKQVELQPPRLADRQAPGREHLLAALVTSAGNVEQVAKQFGRDRKQIYRWMEALGIDSAELERLRK